MSGDAPRTIFNALEKATIADQSKQTDLNQRMVQQALYASVACDQNLSGVIHGFIVTLSNGAKTVSISEGIALLQKATIIFPDSTRQWIELEAPTTIAIPSGVGDDVWCIVEIEPGTTISQANVDVFDGGAGTYLSELKDKEIRSQPIINIRIGPNNPPDIPEFPAGTGGRIPIALFFMDAAGNVTDGADSVVYCRPILRPFGGDQPRSPAFDFPPDALIKGDAIVRGGGIIVEDGGTTFSFAVTQGKFPSSRIGFSLKSVIGGSDVTGNLIFDTAVSNPPDAVVYVYALPPPYQTGYDPLAPREFIIGGPTVSGKFKSSKYETTTNCIIVVSETGPFSSAASPIQGEPSSGYTGGGVIHDFPWLSSGSPADSDPSEWVYVGAIDSTTGGFKNQEYRGGGHVFPQERFPAQEFIFGNGNTTPNTFDLRVPNAPSATAKFQGAFPATATKLNGSIFLSIAAAVSEPEIMDLTISDIILVNRDYRIYKTQIGGTTIEIPTWEYHTFPADIVIDPDPSTDANFEAIMKWTSYVDRIIANR